MPLGSADAPRARTGAGADDAVRALFDACYRPLVQIAALLVGNADRAEELVQDAFVDLHDRGPVLDGAAAAGFLRRSVVDRCRSARWRRTVAHARDERSVLRDVERGSVAGAGPEEVLAALDRLPQRLREVLVLRHAGGLADAEIAAALSIGAGAVARDGSRGLRRLGPVLAGASDPAAGPEQALREVLADRSAQLDLDPGALELIRQRVAGGPRAPRLVPVRRPAVVAVAAALAVAVTAALVVGLGERQPVPPVPLDPSTPGPAYTVDPPRSSVEVYRVRLRDGSPVLSVETVAVDRPFRPRAALDALFGTPALAAADRSPLGNGRTVVASTRETVDALVVDLGAADQRTRPSTPALGRAWVQAVVHTTQSAYGSRLPVLLRLRGRPFTFYGLDTTRPFLAARLPEVRDLGIQLPRAGATVRAPVQLAANLPAGDFEWFVLDTPGNAVFTEETSGPARSGSFSSDLPPGRYRLLVTGHTRPGGRLFRRDVRFAVSTASTAPAPAPVSDAPSTALDLVPVYWARTGGQLVRELRTRRAPAEMLTDYFAVPPGSDGAARADARARVSSVTVTAGAAVVDFSRLPVQPAGPATGPARRQAQAFAATVRSVLGADLPVVVTQGGSPATFLGQVSLPAPGTTVQADQEAVPYPQPVHERGRAEIVGVTRNPATPTTYVLYDAVSHEARFDGTVPGVDPRTGAYGFAVAAPPGRYLLAVHSTDIHERGRLDTAEVRVG